MNVLVTGCNGQLGMSIKFLKNHYPRYNFLFADKSNLDITSEKMIFDFFKTKNIDVLVNCAAYTMVDKAENDFDNANLINNISTIYLSEICKKFETKFIHISTDYVFEGNLNVPYKENDKTNPQTTYGITKLNGEKNILNINPKNSVIIRTSWLYSPFGKNFVSTMIDLGKKKSEISVVNDQIGSPTNAIDLARVILDIIPKINNDNVEIYHFSNTGKCSWYKLAKTLFKIKNIKIKINPVSSTKFPTKAIRPKYSLLDKTKIIKKFSIKILNWKESLINLNF